jgi:hypothetical protein
MIFHLFHQQAYNGSFNFIQQKALKTAKLAPTGLPNQEHFIWTTRTQEGA